ncbi:MAG: outer membrane beta-barrel protein [Saprospiraceae bacterium]|uniref:Outer membrane beta-barrel protein n=2 Tax=Candidatus Opimibacter skivensis TaxID=2982028 RepID=A0A9D7SY45_9BACT|nr:outer membrane beta-barrel protein [Candidatus Opimibacter skivensis]
MNICLSKYITIISIALCLTTQLSAQVNKSSFKGNVRDESDLPIPGATIMILNAADSVLTQFGSSKPDGSFLIKNVPKGDYLINITFLGLAPFYQSIVSGSAEEIDLGKLTMKTHNTILNEVEVKADEIPIEIKKDTILYNADAFKTQPNANVEDLLKKLPGIEVGSDGSIKAQGEDVQKVLVDGKEFFGTDPKMATKNLPARAVKKVKVYDKQSDMAEFTGVDDGEREKTIDLQLREEFKKGLFGTAEAGYGTDERYNAKASINKFTKTAQLSFLGQLNNINDQGFSFQDMMNFSGGMNGMGGGRGGRTMEFNIQSDIPFNDGLSNGLVNTGAGGLNFNWHKTKKFNFRSSYFYNGVDKSLLQDAFRQNLSAMPFNTDENSDQSTKNHNHAFTFNSDIKPDSTQQVTIRARAGLGNGSSINQALLKVSDPLGSLISQSNTGTNANSDNLSLSGSATYMKRLGNKGRNFSVSSTLSKNDNNTDNKLDALTEYFITGDPELLNQLQYTDSKNNKIDGQFSYTEPLKRRKFIEFNYNYSHQEDNYDHQVNDIVGSIPVLNPGLSSNYTSLLQYHKPGVTFRYSGDVHNVNVALQYQASELTGHLNQGENEIKKTYNYFLPRIIWRDDIGNGKNLRISYTTRITQPTITQLSPVVDNSDPLRLYVGNPDLNAEYIHNLSANFHLFSQFSSTSFFISAGTGLTKNKIITSRTTDAQFVETSKPINIDHESRMNLYTAFGRPLKLIHSRFSINLNGTLTSTQNLINNELSDLNRWSRTAGLTISNMNSEVLEYNIGGDWTFTDSYYKISDALNQNTVLHHLFVDATLTLWKKWKLEGSFDYNLYTSAAFAQNQSLPLMKASISRFVLPMDRGQIKLSIFDALDENRGLSRTSDINYIEEVRSNSIGRYVMLSFVYSIKGAGQDNPMGGMRMMMGPRH